MSSISNDKANNKKMFLCLAIVCLLLVVGGVALTTGSAYQKEQEEITELYDQCMDDDYLLPIVEGADNREEFCQCRAEMMHDADMRLMDTLEVAGEYELMRTSNYTGITTDSEGLANVGSHYYCVAKVREEE